jgi:hypothetical protein
MTEADGGGGPTAGQGRQWDVALSFAGAQRDYVGQVAAALKARGVRCFYDADEQVRLWGTYLAEELPRIYTYESAAVVVFVSADYAGRDWTRLERRAAFGRAVAEAGVYVLPARFDDSELPGLLPDVVTVDLRGYTPAQFADLVVEKLADLAISPSPTGGTDRRPPGGVRVSAADPRRLGVHAAISLPGVPDEILPEYVPRDADAAESGVRAKVAAAAERGGFVLLVGGSSVGKTRCVFEAVRALLPDWWLVHPAGPDQVAALAAAPSPRTVVWLDELQRYLDGEHGLTGGVVRALLNAPHPVVIIGTLWPDLCTAWTVLPASGSADPHAREREVLDLAAVIGIGSEFTEAEQGRARAAAARDRRLKIALGAAGYGLTQTLAAAPQLVARWEHARTASPYAWAVLTAALDAARLGARAPLSAGLLRAAAPGYCTSQQQAEAPGNWFEQALAYATAKLHGAAAALAPAGVGMGQLAGYTAADYLIQLASQERRSARVPACTWDAILGHIRDPADTARLADSARRRLLYRYAIPLYRHAAGNGYGTWWLADLLARHSDLDELRDRAGDGDPNAAHQLARLLAEHGDLDEAAQILRDRADAGDGYAALRLVELLAEHGGVGELGDRANAGDVDAAIRLARLLAEHGDVDELRDRANAGAVNAAMQLARLLAEHGDVDELRARADAGNAAAAYRLAGLLAEHGDLDGLRAQAGAGNPAAAYQLARLLAEHGDLDGAAQILRNRADAGDPGGYLATQQLADLLARHGDPDGAAQILRDRANAGDPEAAARLVEVLAEHGDMDELRARADAGHMAAAYQLARLLAEHGDIDELRDRANIGDDAAAEQLGRILVKQSRGEEAKRLRRFGLNPDGSIARA